MHAEHLDEATWERLMMDELSPDERSAALDHAVSCSRCAVIYKGLLAVEAGAKSFDEGAVPPRSARVLSLPRRLLIPLAAAAAILVAFILVPRTGPVPVRGGHGAEIRVIGPSDQVEPPIRFSWSPVEGARRYRVHIFTEDGRPLYTSAELDQTSLAWPSGVPESPGTYFWRVEGSPIEAESKLIRVVVGKRADE
jgi:hypothetical protein